MFHWLLVIVTHVLAHNHMFILVNTSLCSFVTSLCFFCHIILIFHHIFAVCLSHLLTFLIKICGFLCCDYASLLSYNMSLFFHYNSCPLLSIINYPFLFSSCHCFFKGITVCCLNMFALKPVVLCLLIRKIFLPCK